MTGHSLTIVNAVASVLLIGLVGLSFLLMLRLRERIAKLHAVRQKLMEQTELLRLATEANHVGVWDYRPATRTVHLSGQWFAMLDREPRDREIPLEEFLDLVHPEERSAVLRSFREDLAGGGRDEVENEIRLLRADGTWCWVLSRGKAVEWNETGAPVRVIGLDLNIQAHREAQEKTARSEAMFRAVFDNAPYGIVINDLEEGWYLEANRTFLEGRGISREELTRLKSDDHVIVERDDKAEIVEMLRKNGFVRNREARVMREDGTVGHITYSSVLLDMQGRRQVLSMTVDVTERKKAEEALKESEARFRSLFMNAPIPLANISLDGKRITVNESLSRTFGYTSEDVPDLDRWWEVAYPDPDYRERVLSAWRSAIDRAVEDNSAVEPSEYRVTCKDGTAKSMIIGANLIADGILVSFFDVTELMEKEAARQESMELLRATFNATTDGILVVNRDYKVTQANRQFYEMWRIPPELQTTDDDLALREFAVQQLADPAGFQKMVNELYFSRVQAMYELPFRDGRVFECYTAPMVMAGREVGRVWDFRDISERKRAEAALRESEARFRTLFRMAPVPLASLSLDGRILDLNDHLTETLGYAIGDITTLEQACYLSFPDPELRGQVLSKWRKNLELVLADRSEVESFDIPMLCKDGTLHTMVIGTKLIGDNIIASFFDVTERKRAEEILRDSERKLRSIFAAMTDTILIVDAEGRFLEVAPTRTLLTDMHPDRVLGKTLGEVFAPEKAAEFHGAIRTSLSENRSVSLDYSLVVDSRQAWFASTISPLSSDRVIWVSRDVSDRRRAEEEKAKLQDQLLQSQKLEAVGVLAGGVAHDFNNMLGAIMGCAELTLVEMDPSDPSRENIVRIVDVTQRSATLTRQLLAFARRQTIEPTVFDVNESVEAVLKMIRRLIGENIELAWLPGAGAYSVRMDPSQFDQVLINLCVNAKDAIGGVGRIAIETDKVSFERGQGEPFPDFTPGEYVLLAVSDDGCGMDRETMDHIFEPFFTTKGVGRGTGMGLATVYGIVKQNGGGIRVYSEKGKGTTFKIYIPRHAAAAAGEKALPSAEIPVSRGETVLIVEDDPTLLDMGTLMLRRLKYSVLSARTPGEAIRAVEESDGEIHLFITDVVMPEMNGRDLADRLLGIRPEMKHLFMSGYTADVIAHQGVLDEGVNFIHKPFSLKELAVKIRKVLD